MKSRIKTRSPLVSLRLQVQERLRMATAAFAGGLLLCCSASVVYASPLSWYGQTTEGRQTLVAPYSGTLLVTAIGGSTAATIEFGRGTNSTDLWPLLGGLPKTNLGVQMFVDNYTAGDPLNIYLRNSNGEIAFSSNIRLDDRTNTAFLDKNGSLGVGQQSIFQPMGTNMWIVHFDDPSSWKFDDDDNDVLMTFSLVPVPEPSGQMLCLTAIVALTFIFARRRSVGSKNSARSVVTISLISLLIACTAEKAKADDGGAYPQSPLVLSGSTLYGTTNSTLFRINVDGGGISTLHTFSFDGPMFPTGLTLSQSSLFGTTQDIGGPSGAGTLFRIGTDGSGLDFLHVFNNPTNGLNPTALTSSGSTLYGATLLGGANGHGAVYQIDFDGSNHKVLYSLDAQLKGAGPNSIVLSGSSLYGTTAYDGTFGQGTLFKLQPNGDFSTLHTFGGANDTAGGGRVTVFEDMIYGASPGSAGGLGGIYRIGTDGNGYSLLHAFSGFDGVQPIGGLVQSGETLYGITNSGGLQVDGRSDGEGTIFAMDIDGSDFHVLYRFGSQPNDGRSAASGLTIVGNTLYGTTYFGGLWDQGTIFSINKDGTGYTQLHSFIVPEPSSVLLAIAGFIGVLTIHLRSSRRRDCRTPRDASL